MITKTITALAILLSGFSFVQANAAGYDNGYGRIWTADNYYYGSNYEIHISRPMINIYGQFKVLHQSYETAEAFCRAIGYRGQNVWSEGRFLFKTDRYMYENYQWQSSYGRHYVSDLTCF